MALMLSGLNKVRNFLLERPHSSPIDLRLIHVRTAGTSSREDERGLSWSDLSLCARNYKDVYQAHEIFSTLDVDQSGGGLRTPFAPNADLVQCLFEHSEC